MGKSCLVCLFGHDVWKSCGEGHDGDLCEGRNLPQRGGGGIAIHLGHLQIKDDEVRIKAGSFLEYLFAILGLQYLEAAAFENRPQEFPATDRIVSDQYSDRRGSLSARRTI